MPYTDLQIKNQMKDYLRERTKDNIASLMIEAHDAVINEDEAAKAPPNFTALGASDWADLKAFLLDDGGTKEYDKPYTTAKIKLDADAQQDFLFNLFLVFKALRQMFKHLET